MKGWMAGALTAVVLATGAMAETQSLNAWGIGRIAGTADVCGIPLSAVGIERIARENGGDPSFAETFYLQRKITTQEIGDLPESERSIVCAWAREAVKTYDIAG